MKTLYLIKNSERLNKNEIQSCYWYERPKMFSYLFMIIKNLDNSRYF